MDQGFEVALGGEAWAADSLRRDKQQSSKTDDFTEEWATPIPPIPIETAASSKASWRTCRAVSISTAW